MVSFRTSRKLSIYLVRAKLYPLERTIGSIKYRKKRYEVCEYVKNSDTFRSSVTSETFKINHRLTCDDKCLVYLFTCKTCSKQYNEETTDQFRLRWNNYKSNNRKFKRGKLCVQEHLFEHSYSDGHNGFLDDVAITLTDKTDCRDPKNRENYWMRTLKTLATERLNIVFCLRHVIFLYLCFESVFRTMQTSGMERLCEIVSGL